jgi:hypothetical protein
MNGLVSPSLSQISGRLCEINIPEASSGRDVALANKGCISLILVKIKKIEVDIGLSNSSIYPTMLSMTKVLRDGKICSFYQFVANIFAVKSVRARKYLLDHVQEMFEALGPEKKLEILDGLGKLEQDGCFDAEWLELFHRFILSSACTGTQISGLPHER